MSVKSNLKKIKCGRQERYLFGHIEEVLDLPYLVEIQKNSYEKDFWQEGIAEILHECSPITDVDNFNGKENQESRIELYFLDYYRAGDPKYSIAECRLRDQTYQVPLKVKTRLVNKETGEVIDQDVFLGDIPLMTDDGSFIINGAERAVVSQLIRSPGVYCKQGVNKTGNFVTETNVMPSRGAWLEFEEDQSGVLYVHVDRQRKMVATVLLRGLGISTNEELLALFDNHPTIKKTIEKDFTTNEEEALVELSKRLRPGEVLNLKAIKSYITQMFYNPRRYDLTRVGRYKFNQKLSVANRIEDLTLARDVKVGNKVLAAKGEVMTLEKGREIQEAGVNEVWVETPKGEFKIIGNNRVTLTSYLYCKPEELGVKEMVHYPLLMEVLKGKKTVEEKKEAVRAAADELASKHLVLDDIIAAVNYHLSIGMGIGKLDDVDHLGNRRVKTVGELMKNQFMIGMTKLERVIRERMQVQDLAEVSPSSLINSRPITAAIREFFIGSQMSQFMEKTNPISALTNKRKLSTLGPGGLSRERASFDVRDVHYTHYGRLCANETPEGQNIGLINSFATYAKINEYGFVEAPYRKVDKATGTVTKEVVYLTADQEDRLVVAQANEPLTEDGKFANSRVICRHKGEIMELPREQVDFMDVSPKALISVATSLIPFIENDESSRAMIASNMQRQAVPLLKTEAPLVATGIEHRLALDSGAIVVAKEAGTVSYVSATRVEVKRKDGTIDTYELEKFTRSNQGTCINQKPIVNKGDKVLKGDVLADGPATCGGELSIGKNILVAFMPWEGYNFEDAILISDELVRDDVLTSVHIEQRETDARDTKLGPEEITRDIPNVGEDALRNLDENGIIHVGAEVEAGDILVGKVTPKGETELTPEERLLRAIFGEKAREVRDTSLRVQHGEGGVVVDVKVFTRENKDELDTGVHKLVRVYIAQKRKMMVGDKMSGRHGNKGVVSRILPASDMPFLPDGTPIQILLNPMGVPSRMNIGQLFETHLGLVAKALDWKVATPVFDGAKGEEIQELLRENGYAEDGKIQLYDGRTGEPFESRATVGYMYMLKLNHLVEDKVHARSTGPYSLVTQQPLGGRAQFGGQRFGEMEVWALEAYGAASTLQEMLTVKSDDVVGRTKTYESIIKSQNVSEPGIPESFKVLIKELQGLGLDVKVLTEDMQEIGLRELVEDDRDLVDVMATRREATDEIELALDEIDKSGETADVETAKEEETDEATDLMGAENIFEFDDIDDLDE